MSRDQNETGDAHAAARRANFIARALQDPQRLARFEAGRDMRDTHARVFAEIEGRAYFRAFTLRDGMVRDLGRPFDEALRELAREILAGDGAPAASADAAPPAPEPAAPSNDPAAAARAVKRLRRRLKLSQHAFARRYGIPVGTLRDWEQARRAPDACGKAYLAVIASAPEIVPQALGAP
jgi:putative transcriptional regulator